MQLDQEFLGYLKECGWYSGRRIAYVENPSIKYQIFPAADKLLSEFTGLVFPPKPKIGAPFEAFDVLVDALVGETNWQRASAFSGAIQSKIYPIAAVADNMVSWYIAEDGRIFRLYLEFEYVGPNFLESLQLTTRGYAPPPTW